MSDNKSLAAALHLLLRRPPVHAAGQAFGVSRDTFFAGTREMLYKHVCPPTYGGGPIDRVEPDRTFELSLMDRFDLAVPPNVERMIGADELPMWIIRVRDRDGLGFSERSFPSPLLRMVQGEIVHAEVSASTNTHTIHWHGIEPTPMNDGVGKHSFEISGNFVYQFQANDPGTFFYHCHKNTTLHFEMGMYGALIVDPPAPGGSGLTAPYETGGPGFVAGRLPDSPAGTTVLRYDIERIWAVDEMDSRWHLPELHHNHSMQDCDEDDPAAPETFYVFDPTDINLNDFRPDIFTVSGAVLDVGERDDAGVFAGVLDDPAVRIDAGVGQIVLLRYVNAGYTIQELTLPVNATVIAWDGQVLGTSGFQRFSFPYVVPAGRPIRTTSGRRMDIILNTGTAVDGLARIRSYDWIKEVPDGLVGHVRIPVVIG
jgi:FtsP/CotA-like multicopper oxidase with cupredoxin domain